MNTQAPLEVQIRLTIASVDSPQHGVFGKGTAVLLRGVERTGSLNKAASELGMAYSKAWTLLRDTEEMFGIALINRDGARGSQLTPDGRQLMEAYDMVQAETLAFAKNCFIEKMNQAEA